MSSIILLPTSTDTLVKATHQGRVCIAGNVASNIIYTIPRPDAAGEWYKFIYGGAAAEAQEHTFTMTTAIYYGGLTFFDTDGDALEVKFSDASNDTSFQVVNPEQFEINMISYSDSIVYVWGNVSADTVFSNFS